MGSFAMVLRHFTLITGIGFAVSFISFLIIDLVYNSMGEYSTHLEYWSLQQFSFQVLAYLNILCITIVSCLPRLLLLLFSQSFAKDEIQIFREVNHKNKQTNKQAKL